jgi:hypothetical protein
VKIELRNVKYAAFASQETLCFEAVIYLDGVKAGTVSNEGHGGSNMYSPWAVEEKLAAHAKTLPAIVSDYLEDDGKPFSYPASADTVIDDLLQAFLAERDLRRLLKSKLAFIKGGKLYATKKLTPAQLGVLTSDPAGTKARHKADAILNVLPFDEAMALYRKHG